MATVYLTSTRPREDDALARLRRSAVQDPFGIHALTDDPEGATLILFAESWEADWLLGAVRRHPLLKRHREKCFVACENDHVAHMLPGVYTNVTPFSAATGRVRQGFYLWMYENPFVEYAPEWPSGMNLYSFVGSLTTAAVRRQLHALEHPRGHIQDTSDESPFIWWEADAATKASFRKEYAMELRQSKFVLCPRGVSPSTVRLFETMKTGRVPVILSDDWVPPTGPAWNEFSLRIPEDRVKELPSLLEAYEPRAEQMGTRARAVWEEWFSPRVSFHRTTEWCLDIQRSRRVPERLARLAGYGELLLTPRGVRHLLRHFYYRTKHRFSTASKASPTSSDEATSVSAS